MSSASAPDMAYVATRRRAACSSARLRIGDRGRDELRELCERLLDAGRQGVRGRGGGEDRAPGTALDDDRHADRRPQPERARLWQVADPACDPGRVQALRPPTVEQ